jgi:hypothetical protein
MFPKCFAYPCFLAWAAKLRSTTFSHSKGKTARPSAPFSAEELPQPVGWRQCSIPVLVAKQVPLASLLAVVGMAVTPIPISALPAAVFVMKIRVLPMALAQINPIRTVLIIIPLVIIVMVSVVIARVIAFMRDHYFLCANLRCCCCGHSRGQQEIAYIFIAFETWMHKFSINRRLPPGVLSCTKYGRHALLNLSYTALCHSEQKPVPLATALCAGFFWGEYRNPLIVLNRFNR